MPEVNCPKCNHKVRVGSTECPNCGVIFQKYQQTILDQQKEVQEYYEQERQKHRQKQEEEQQEREKQRQEQRNKLRHCDACESTISTRANICPRCGEPQKPSSQSDIFQDSSIATIFDFHFHSFITPTLVKVIYVLSAILILITVVAGVIGSLFVPSFLGKIISMIGAITAGILYIFLTRIFCEGVLLLFQIEENTRK